MFEEHGIILARAQLVFYGTDTFGNSLINDIIEPLVGECRALGQMAEELKYQIIDIDTALAEVRAMEV